MGLHQELPIYKACYDLVLEMFQLVKDFSREYKFTIGERLKNETMELLILIFRANTREDKREVLKEARENVEVVRLLVRLLKDLKQISLKKFVFINQKIENVSRQLTGWQRSLNKKYEK